MTDDDGYSLKLSKLKKKFLFDASSLKPFSCTIIFEATQLIDVKNLSKELSWNEKKNPVAFWET